MKGLKRSICLVLGITMVGVAFASCGGAQSSAVQTENDTPLGSSYSNELQFLCSDSDMEFFLNDYYSRNIRNGEDAIGGLKMGGGSTYQKIWETDSLCWFDSSQNALQTYDAIHWIRAYLTNLTIDKYGYVYSMADPINPSSETAPYQSMGWPFPSYDTKVGIGENISYGANFKSDLEGWTASGGTIKHADGALQYSFSGSVDQEFSLSVKTLDANGRGYNTVLFGNFLEVEMIWEDLSSQASMTNSGIEDWYLSWQTEEGGDEWFSVSQKEWAVNPHEPIGNDTYRTNFPLYMHEEWDEKHVTALKITIKPQQGESLKINGRLDFVHMMADTRHSTNIANYICALENYVSFSNDIDFLKAQINRARRAMLFQLNALQGKDGLLDLSYFRGHALAPNDGYDDGKDFYYGYISTNGFWDVLPTGHKNAEANYYFYMSLKSLIKLEEFLADAGVTVEEEATVVRHDTTHGGEYLIYNETADSLTKLAEKVKTNICKDVQDGGFWNPKTGRFAWAVYDADNKQTGSKKGEPMDYGYTELNFRMIQEGIATAEQAKSIMSWVNGERIVAGDDSQGEDIYYFDFAPRVSTKENLNDYVCIWLEVMRNKKNRWTFGYNCQSGGANLFVSYYDMMARSVTAGADDCFNRLKEIQQWYSACYEKYSGTGRYFYDNYYTDLILAENLEGKNGWQYVIQGVERGKNGALGLDSEFLESSLVYATVPFAFFGLDADSYSNLTIAPQFPSALSYFGMRNLMYAGIPYDCMITKNSIEISNVDGKTKGLTLTLRMVKPEKTFAVKIDGQDTANYVVKGDYVEMKIPFRPMKVQIVEK